MTDHEAIWQDIEVIARLDATLDERWRDIPGYEGYYAVSNLGRVRSIGGRKYRRKDLILSPIKNNRYGHLAVNLYKDDTRWTISIHKLVAAAWIGPCPKGQQVRHGPNGKLDNSVSNLCYGTKSQDQRDRRRDGTHNGRPIRRSDGTVFINISVAAEKMNCTCTNIWSVCNGRQKTAGGYGWEYVKEDEEIEERNTDAELPEGNSSNRKVFGAHQESIQ